MAADLQAEDWVVRESDRELFDRELSSFVPERIFDAHAHLYCVDHFQAGEVPGLAASGPPIASLEEFDRRIDQITPGRATEGLFFPFPHATVDVAAENEFLFQQLSGESSGRPRQRSRGQMLVTPQMDPDFIRETIRRTGFVGLKCYHVWSPRRPTFASLIEEYLPESQVQIADELGLSMTLHIVRDRALADPANQETIGRYCRLYPNMRLILAHAARGFNAHHTIQGIHSLRGLANVWFDTSAVTDSGAIEAIIRVMGHERVLYGSDFPVSHLRGRCVAIGDSFVWISAANTDLNAAYGTIVPALVGHEALRTLKIAAMSTGLSDSQVEDIFCHNAEELFGISS